MPPVIISTRAGTSGPVHFCPAIFCDSNPPHPVIYCPVYLLPGPSEEAARTMSWNRSFFTTKNGYLGLGPQLLQPGDWVCVLFGAKAPFILRRYNRKCKLVGEAYLHGAKDGEIVGQYEEGRVPHKLFEIV